MTSDNPPAHGGGPGPDARSAGAPVRRCACPGSYDPVTLGHLDIIGRAARLYDEVVVIVLHNPRKAGLFPVAERVGLLRGEIEDDPALANVRVAAFSGRLLVDVCRELDIEAIVKGVRSEADYAYELPMAVMNRRMSGIETLFLPGAPEYSQVSSSLMKEVVRFGGDIGGLVPERVRAALGSRLGAREDAGP